MITMSKNKEYSSDVQQKMVELNKIQSGSKKISKELKIIMVFFIFIMVIYILCIVTQLHFYHTFVDFQ